MMPKGHVISGNSMFYVRRSAGIVYILECVNLKRMSNYDYVRFILIKWSAKYIYIPSQYNFVFYLYLYSEAL
jgi:hypothetical protein